MAVPFPVALTIAGSDPSGGAGIQADLKTFHQFGVYGTAAITLLTVQNTRRVSQVAPMAPELVAAQIEAILDDIPPAAAKTGALGIAAIVETVAEQAQRFAFPLVVDPVMVSKHGTPLVDDSACEAIRTKLLPVAFLVTPNVPEAEALSGMRIESPAAARSAADRIRALGARYVLIKGGHFTGEDSADLLIGERIDEEFRAARIDTRHTHGTGCTYSAAITALLASGEPVENAVRRAKRFITAAIATAPGLGGGYGPVNHFALTD